jgi:hypothetical protein
MLQGLGNPAITATALAYSGLGLLLQLSGVWGVLFEVVVDFILFGLSEGLANINTAMNSTNQDLLQCILYCHFDTNNQLDAGRFAAVQADVTSLIGGTSATILNALLTLWGYGGVNTAAALKLNTGVCTGCGCVWCQTFDFTLSDGGFVVLSGFNAAYIPGTGWQSQASGGNDILEIKRTFTSTFITDLEVTYTTGHAASGGTRSTENWNVGGVVGHLPLNSGTGTFTTTQAPNYAMDRLDVYLDTASAHNKNTITKIVLKGTGTNPFGASNC